MESSGGMKWWNEVEWWRVMVKVRDGVKLWSGVVA